VRRRQTELLRSGERGWCAERPRRGGNPGSHFVGRAAWHCRLSLSGAERGFDELDGLEFLRSIGDGWLELEPQLPSLACLDELEELVSSTPWSSRLWASVVPPPNTVKTCSQFGLSVTSQPELHLVVLFGGEHCYAVFIRTSVGVCDCKGRRRNTKCDVLHLFILRFFEIPMFFLRKVIVLLNPLCREMAKDEIKKN
jgi:hypothetical protein